VSGGNQVADGFHQDVLALEVGVVSGVLDHQEAGTRNGGGHVLRTAANFSAWPGCPGGGTTSGHPIPQTTSAEAPPGFRTAQRRAVMPPMDWPTITGSLRPSEAMN